MCFGGAALTTSSAAYRRVCLPFGVLAFRVTWFAALFLSLAASSPAATQKSPLGEPSAFADSRWLSPTTDSPKVESAATAQSAATQQVAQQPANAQPQAVVERIEFIGNRRIRTDTLKARIFSREGDPYNEETLRRDFQALWNTQFFEDVKLQVEDSSDRPDGKIIIFNVTERPQIRRIRYEGNKSVSESDILDRFKERKVGLSVESPFDPTKIKKAEVVLKELEGEHGRQFATVTPQYERIASSNAVILVFKIDEGPKVKVGDHQVRREPLFQRSQAPPRHETRPPLRNSALFLRHPRDGQDLRSRKTQRGHRGRHPRSLSGQRFLPCRGRPQRSGSAKRGRATTEECRFPA